MIKTFKCRETEKILNNELSKKFPHTIQRRARKKLKLLQAAKYIFDLRYPPSNYLEKLSGKRKYQYSIRINKQWRICFKWINGEAIDVEIVDYH